MVSVSGVHGRSPSSVAGHRLVDDLAAADHARGRTGVAEVAQEGGQGAGHRTIVPERAAQWAA